MEKLNKEISEKLPTVDIHGKEYVMVKDRIMEFHRRFPFGSITTEITINGDYVLSKATVITNEVPQRTFTGHSEAIRGSQGITGQSSVEVAETSAVGRALGMASIGILESVASADEIRKAPSGGAGEVKRSSMPATEKQKAFIKKLISEKGRPMPEADWFMTLDMTTAKATIDSLLAAAPVIIDEDGNTPVRNEDLPF